MARKPQSHIFREEATLGSLEHRSAAQWKEPTRMTEARNPEEMLLSTGDTEQDGSLVQQDETPSCVLREK